MPERRHQRTCCKSSKGKNLNKNHEVVLTNKNHNDENAEDSDNNNAEDDNDDDLNTDINGDDESSVNKGDEDKNTDVGGGYDNTIIQALVMNMRNILNLVITEASKKNVNNVDVKFNHDVSSSFGD